MFKQYIMWLIINVGLQSVTVFEISGYYP